MRALSVAATGMDAQQTNLEVIANNIANINTTGYKRARAEFADLLYQTERAQGVPNRANQAIVPEGANIGLGVQTVAVRNIHTQGELAQTDNTLDMAIVGRGAKVADQDAFERKLLTIRKQTQNPLAALAEKLTRSRRHVCVFTVAMLLGVIVLVGGQTLLQHGLDQASSLSVVIDFVGGLVFILLLFARRAR